MSGLALLEKAGWLVSAQETIILTEDHCPLSAS